MDKEAHDIEAANKLSRKSENRLFPIPLNTSTNRDPIKRKFSIRKTSMFDSWRKTPIKRNYIFKTNICAFVTVLITYYLFESFSARARSFHSECKELSLRGLQLSKCYFYLTLCYSLSIICDFTYFYYKHKILVISSTVFSIVATLGQIMIDYIFIFIISITLFKQEECGSLRYLSMCWLVVTIIAVFSLSAMFFGYVSENSDTLTKNLSETVTSSDVYHLRFESLSMKS